jgi:hypothetical protein
MTINLTSTTDTPEQVTAALGKTTQGAPATEANSSATTAEKAAGQNDSQASEPGEADDTDVSENETGGSETEGESESAETENETETTEGKPQGKKKGGFQRRIDKLNQRYTLAQQEAEYWKQQALKGAQATKQDAPKVDQAQAAPSEKEPDPNDFDDHAKFVRALARWEAKQEILAERKAEAEKQQKSRAETEAQRLDREHAERVQAFRSKHDDFDEILQDGLSDVPASPALEQVIKSSDNGPELLYELAKDPKEAARIARLAPMALAREIGKLEARIASKASETTSPQPKRITNAPKPLTPVNARGGATEKSPDQMNYQEFKKWREGQLKTRRS